MIYIRLLLVLTILLTFALINLGGYVHNTGSSLACPDWPLCHGQFIPLMSGGVLIEHSHRLLASLVGLCVLSLTFVTRKNGLFRYALLALALVTVQGVLGGLTVLYQLPPLISTAHLALAHIFLCTLIFIHDRAEPKKAFLPRKSRLLPFVMSMLFIQIVYGAFMRHQGAGPVCGLGAHNRISCLGNWLPLNALQALHMGHRYLGALIGVLLLALSVKVIREGRFLLAVFFASMVGLQLWLGTEVIRTGIRPVTTMLHLGGASLLLATVWKLKLQENYSI